MTDRYQAGYKAALTEIAAQLRTDAVDRAHPVAESILLDLANSIAEQTPDADPEAPAQPTTPAPAWAIYGVPMSAAEVDLGVVRARIYKSPIDLQWWAHGQGEHDAALGPYPTAPEAARAAVAALRAIVVPVVEALDRVPELDDAGVSR